MKHPSLFALVLLPFIAACNRTIAEDNTDTNVTKVNTDAYFESNKNIQTRNYKDIREENLFLGVDDGYVKISSVIINSEHFIEVEETITYLYKLSCKDSSDSFKKHLFNSDDDGCYYAEISETQHGYIPNGFTTLKNSNHAGSSVEITIDKIYKCFTYRELYYSESEQKIKIVDFDHVIPGLEESEVNSLLGKSIDYSVYVDESGIKSMNYGNLPFETELIIKYIDVSESNIKIN